MLYKNLVHYFHLPRHKLSLSKLHDLLEFMKIIQHSTKLQLRAPDPSSLFLASKTTEYLLHINFDKQIYFKYTFYVYHY